MSKHHTQPNIAIMPSLEGLKSVLLAQAKFYDLPEVNGSLSLEDIFNAIKAHKVELIELVKRTAQAEQENYRAYAQFTEEQKSLILEKANAYHIPYSKDNLNYLRLAYTIDDYELMLDQATDCLIDWDTSIYNPEGLQQAINEYDQERYFDSINGYYDNEPYLARATQEYNDWKAYNSDVRQVYNNSRGV